MKFKYEIISHAKDYSIRRVPTPKPNNNVQNMHSIWTRGGIHKIRTQCDDKLFLLCRKIRSVDRHERNKKHEQKIEKQSEIIELP